MNKRNEELQDRPLKHQPTSSVSYNGVYGRDGGGTSAEGEKNRILENEN